MSSFFVSICIPSYNRPEGLKRALESVNSIKYADELQIVVCEDKAPKREEVGKVVADYSRTSKYNVKYVENEVNYGHGKNWRQCAHQSEGEYLIYMGDDDMFVPNALDPFIEWLHKHSDLGYVLRAYQILNPNGTIEDHRYYNKDKFFEPGMDAYLSFFWKSNLMSGYTIKRELTYEFEDDSVDYTLFYQMYLMAEICLRYKSGYCNIPIAQYVGDGVSFFGVNEKEKSYYKPGENVANDLSNIQKFFVVTDLIDRKNSISSTYALKNEFAKYSSYPTMAKYRAIGIKELYNCKKQLEEMGLHNSTYFSIYYYALLFLGGRICSAIIHFIKMVHGGRPEL